MFDNVIASLLPEVETETRDLIFDVT